MRRSVVLAALAVLVVLGVAARPGLTAAAGGEAAPAGVRLARVVSAIALPTGPPAECAAIARAGGRCQWKLASWLVAGVEDGGDSVFVKWYQDEPAPAWSARASERKGRGCWAPVRDWP